MTHLSVLNECHSSGQTIEANVAVPHAQCQIFRSQDKVVLSDARMRDWHHAD